MRTLAWITALTVCLAFWLGVGLSLTAYLLH